MDDHGSIAHGRMHENGPFYPRQYVPPRGQPSVDAPAPAGHVDGDMITGELGKLWPKASDWRVRAARRAYKVIAGDWPRDRGDDW